jgi:hypothetical protein
MRVAAWRLAAVALLVVEAHAPSALCQSQEAAATELFEAGRDLMKAGSFAEACPKLAASLRLDPKVGTLARLAECEEHIGQLANAHAHWARAQSLARSAHDPRLARIQQEFARIDRLVSKLSIELSTPTTVANLRLDGIDMGPVSSGLELPVGGGKHTVEVVAEGKLPWSTDITVAGDGSVVKVEVPALKDAPVPVSPPALAPAPPIAPVAPAEVSRRPYRTPGIIVGAAGVAGVTASVFVGMLIANKKYDDSTAHGCSGSICNTTTGQDDRMAALTAGNVATGIFVGGVVLAAVGVTLILLPPKAAHDAPAAALHIGPESLSIGGAF